MTAAHKRSQNDGLSRMGCAAWMPAVSIPLNSPPCRFFLPTLLPAHPASLLLVPSCSFSLTASLFLLLSSCFSLPDSLLLLLSYFSLTASLFLLLSCYFSLPASLSLLLSYYLSLSASLPQSPRSKIAPSQRLLPLLRRTSPLLSTRPPAPWTPASSPAA